MPNRVPGFNPCGAGVQACAGPPGPARTIVEVPPRLELRRVSKTYANGGQPVAVLHDISLAAESGTVTALLGRSGCGKTTLLNLAGAMDFPTSGEVLIDGRSTCALSDGQLTALRRESIGFVFQAFQLLPTLTALENVELPLLLARAPNSAAIAE